MAAMSRHTSTPVKAVVQSSYAHAANLFDLNSKYADVITFEELKQMAPLSKETVRA